MNNLLNPSQRRSLVITLRIFEEELNYIDTWLHASETSGILYHKKLLLSQEKIQLVKQIITTALEEIATLTNKFGFEPEEDNPASLICGMMSESWANLLDSQSTKLKRYGEVDPNLGKVLDPSIEKLAKLALELEYIFEDHCMGKNPPI